MKNNNNLNQEDKNKSKNEEPSNSHDALFEFKPIGTIDEEIENEILDKDNLADVLRKEQLTDVPKKEEFSSVMKKQKSQDILKKQKSQDISKNEKSPDTLKKQKSQDTSKNEKSPDISKKEKLSDIWKKEELSDLLNSPIQNSFKKEENEVLYDEQNINKKEKNEVLFDEQNIKNNEKIIDSFSLNEIQSLIESALYVCGNEGLSLNDLKHLTELPANTIKKIMKEWMQQLDNDDSRGLAIKIFGDKYKFFSKPSNREKLSRLITIKYRNPLSTKVMETLAIIAYNQPCTKSIIQDIRAKDPSSSIERLLDLGLIVDAGRADSPGRPLLFTVSHKFYDIFGLKNLNELPIINLMQPFQDDDVSFFDTNRFDE